MLLKASEWTGENEVPKELTHEYQCWNCKSTVVISSYRDLHIDKRNEVWAKCPVCKKKGWWLKSANAEAALKMRRLYYRHKYKHQNKFVKTFDTRLILITALFVFLIAMNYFF